MGTLQQPCPPPRQKVAPKGRLGRLRRRPQGHLVVQISGAGMPNRPCAPIGADYELWMLPVMRRQANPASMHAPALSPFLGVGSLLQDTPKLESSPSSVKPIPANRALSCH